jgi:hypothetical protein
MMLYVLGVSAACFLILTITGVLRDIPDAEQAASIYLGVAALAGVVAWAAARAAGGPGGREAPAEQASQNT